MRQKKVSIVSEVSSFQRLSKSGTWGGKRCPFREVSSVQGLSKSGTWGGKRCPFREVSSVQGFRV